ncbi:hypothetical protein [Acidaminococcus sp.]|uniref:hypothetical protein n=1 Tax=Acidaminococcus sp. TaxID=1872103 RepID=UPI003D7CE42F
MKDVCKEIVETALEPFVKKGDITGDEMFKAMAKIAVECYRRGVKDGKAAKNE